MIRISCKVCGKEFGISPSRIKTKKYCSRLCMNTGHKGLHRGKEIKKGEHLSPATQFKKGQTCPNYKGFHKSEAGYIYIWKPEHPSAQKKGYINRSILVVEKEIGRFLSSDEIVHHINEIKNDDRPENLMVMTKEEHARHHTTKRWENNSFR